MQLVPLRAGFARLYDEYEANLRSSNAMDFDDLLSASVVGFMNQHSFCGKTT